MYARSLASRGEARFIHLKMVAAFERVKRQGESRAFSKSPPASQFSEYRAGQNELSFQVGMVRVLDQVVVEQAGRASSHQLLPAVDHDAERMLRRDLLVNIPERQLAAVRQPVVLERLAEMPVRLGDQASVLKQAAEPEMSLGEAGMAVEDSAVERLAKCWIRRFHAAHLEKLAHQAVPFRP